MTTTNVEDDLDPIAIEGHEVTLLRTALNHLEALRARVIPMETMAIRTWVMQEIANPVVET